MHRHKIDIVWRLPQTSTLFAGQAHAELIQSNGEEAVIVVTPEDPSLGVGQVTIPYRLLDTAVQWVHAAQARELDDEVRIEQEVGK